VYSRKSAIEADEGGADIIYYDILKDDFASTKRAVRNALFFAYTPRILSDSQVEEVAERIKRFSPDGILIANRGLLKPFEGWRIHLDQSFNCFNDIDMQCYSGIPIISPELNFKEATEMKNKRFIVQVQGDIVVMTTKCRLKAPELIDEEERHFKVREYNGLFEITNYKQMGLFSRTKEYIPHGIKYFYMNLPHDAGKFVRIYKKVIELYFDDKRIRKGYTKGHFDRGVE